MLPVGCRVVSTSGCVLSRAEARGVRVQGQVDGRWEDRSNRGCRRP
jgi:ribosomal protein S8